MDCFFEMMVCIVEINTSYKQQQCMATGGENMVKKTNSSEQFSDVLTKNVLKLMGHWYPWRSCTLEGRQISHSCLHSSTPVEATQARSDSGVCHDVCTSGQGELWPLGVRETSGGSMGQCMLETVPNPLQWLTMLWSIPRTFNRLYPYNVVPSIQTKWAKTFDFFGERT